MHPPFLRCWIAFVGGIAFKRLRISGLPDQSRDGEHIPLAANGARMLK